MAWTYSDLKTKVASYLARTDLSSQIDDAILLFESEYNTRKGVWRRLEASTLTTTAGTSTVNLPADFERPVSLQRDNYPSSIIISGLQAAADYRTAAQGEPRIAAVYPNNKMLFAPIPDGVYTYELLYYPRMEGLTPTVTTNWLIEKYPHIYLYGVLAYMQDYIRDDGRKATVVAQHEANMAMLESSLVSVPEGQGVILPAVGMA